MYQLICAALLALVILLTPLPSSCAAQIASRADDSRDIELSLVPQFTSIAPFQPLYLRVDIINGSTKEIRVPYRLQGSLGLYLMLSEGDRSRKVNYFHYKLGGEVLGPGNSLPVYLAVCFDFFPPDPRRSSRRVFDLPGKYLLHVTDNPAAKPDEFVYRSKPVEITVREPTEDEAIAGEDFADGTYPRPFHSQDAGSRKGKIAPTELMPRLGEFLQRYPESAFADDVRWLLRAIAH